MKLTHLNIKNVLGVRTVDVPLTRPVTLFAGKNGAGKSSVQEAISIALVGESARNGAKKVGQLITKGAEYGFAEVEIDGAVRAFVTLPDGKTTPMTEYVPPTALPYVLDAQRFAKLDANERRTFLFGLMGLSASGAEAKKRLIDKGCDEQKIEAIMPMLRSGFDAAHKEACARARDEKAAWRTITGETYGDKKAEKWAAEKSGGNCLTPAFNPSALAELQESITMIDGVIATGNQRMGALMADHKRHAEASQRLAQLREKSSRYARVAEKLVRDEAELKEWEAKVEDARQRAAGGRKVGLVHDLARALFNLLDTGEPCTVRPGEDPKIDAANHALNAYEDEHGSIKSSGADDSEAQNKLPEYEKALHLLQNSVANDKRDLAEADATAKAISELEAAAGNAPCKEEIHAASKHLDDLKADRTAIAKKLADQQDAQRQAKHAEERTANAMTAHKSVLAWMAVAEALASNGIPGEMLAEALGPINNRLKQSSQDAEWLNVHIENDMTVWGAAYPDQPAPLPYAMLSESEKWRADAMLAEAIAHISNTKVLVLDRFDVLDMRGREDLLAWLDILAQNDEINTALIFGTLKALPTALPQTIAAHWIENGVIK